MNHGDTLLKIQHAIIDYTNHRDERRERRIVPRLIAWGSTTHHPEPCWLLSAYDVEKQDWRDFKMANIHSWRDDDSI